MADENGPSIPDRMPASGKGSKAGRAILSAAGSIPFAGGLFSAAAGYWSDAEQEKANDFLKQWMEMLQEELAEKEKTVVEIMARLDLQDKKIAERISSTKYQSLVKKTFRDWSMADSEEKRTYIRNILANAAATDVSSDDVIRMFFDWLNQFSELHFQVIAAIYNSDGITRGGIWEKIGKNRVREDSADADLYKLLIRDLSTGSIIRQHRETDYQGNFVPKTAARRPKGSGRKPPVSAFDREEGYELTQLGQQFVHYAMSDLPLQIGSMNDE